MKRINTSFDEMLANTSPAIQQEVAMEFAVSNRIKDKRYMTTTLKEKEQLTYVLILANANKKGIQRLELTFERK